MCVFFFFFLFVYNYGNPEFLHKVVYEILKNGAKGIVLQLLQSI